MHTSQTTWKAETLAATLIDVSWLPSGLAALPLALVRFFRHQCVLWGAALAYYTLIGLVPVLTAVFAILRGLELHHELTPYVMNTIGAGSDTVAQQVVDFIDQTNARAVFVISAIVAVLAIFGILGNAELCFNSIWGGVPGRPLGHKLRTYTKVAVLAPALLVVTLALTALLQPGTRTYAFFDGLYLGDVVVAVLRVLPYALLWVSFTVIYRRLPNTTVRLRSAIFGAVVAGTLWQMAQWTYVTFVIRLVRYSAVYGALWQVPILLAWVYIGWMILLSGAEVASTLDEVQDVRRERAAQRAAREQSARGPAPAAAPEEQSGIPVPQGEVR
jgi:membrane protein